MKKLAVLLIMIITACSVDRFEQAQIQAYPEDLSTLYVRYGNGNFQKQKNGEDFTVEHIAFVDSLGVNRARTSVTSNSGFRMDYGYINLFDNLDANDVVDSNLEINWKRIGSSFSAEYDTKSVPVNYVEITLHTDNE